jgi:hypothetical protein
MTRAEFFYNRTDLCGDMDGYLVRAMNEATKITFNGKVINDWPRAVDPSDFPIIIFFEDGSVLKAEGTTDSKVALYWGINLNAMN